MDISISLAVDSHCIYLAACAYAVVCASGVASGIGGCIAGAVALLLKWR